MVHDGNYGLSCFRKHFDETFHSKKSALPERAAISHGTSTHMAIVEPPTLNAFMHAEDSDLEWSGTASTVWLLASISRYDCGVVLVKQPPVHEA